MLSLADLDFDGEPPFAGLPGSALSHRLMAKEADAAADELSKATAPSVVDDGLFEAASTLNEQQGELERLCTDRGLTKSTSALTPIKKRRTGHYGRCHDCRARRHRER